MVIDGLNPGGEVHRNLAPAELVERAVLAGEGRLSDTGALVVDTAPRTGRSAKDKFIVDAPDVHDEIAWGAVNRPVSQQAFDALYARVADYLAAKGELYVFDGYAGVHPQHDRAFRVVCELASQALFANQMLGAPRRVRLQASRPTTRSWWRLGSSATPAVTARVRVPRSWSTSGAAVCLSPARAIPAR